jgi:hypothetical protein
MESLRESQPTGRAILTRAKAGETDCHRPAQNKANPQFMLHNSYTGQNGRKLSIIFNGLDKSKDLERVKGIEPSS